MSNCIHLTIRDCQHCPCATLKYDQGSEKDIMYCQTDGSLIMLREDWGTRPIPNWCPYLKKEIKMRKQQNAYRANRKSGATKPKENSNEK